MQRSDVLTAPAFTLDRAAPARAARPAAIETADGARLFYSDWGEGAPVVFLHSWGGNTAMWDYQIAELTQHGLRCIAYDRRGHGRSSDPGRGYDADTLADDLAAVMETLDLRDATLVGHSMGGGEIVRYLSRHGDARVAKAVLLAPTTPFMLKTEDNPAGVDAAMIEATRAMWRLDFPQWVADNAAPFFTPETSAGLREWGIRALLQTPLPVLLASNQMVMYTDFRPDLRAIKKPVLVIHGDQDASAPLELTGRPTAQLIPGAELIVYEGAPHGLFLTHIAELNQDLRAFVGA